MPASASRYGATLPQTVSMTRTTWGMSRLIVIRSPSAASSICGRMRAKAIALAAVGTWAVTGAEEAAPRAGSTVVTARLLAPEARTRPPERERSHAPARDGRFQVEARLPDRARRSVFEPHKSYFVTRQDRPPAFPRESTRRREITQEKAVGMPVLGSTEHPTAFGLPRDGRARRPGALRMPAMCPGERQEAVGLPGTTAASADGAFRMLWRAAPGLGRAVRMLSRPGGDGARASGVLAAECAHGGVGVIEAADQVREGGGPSKATGPSSAAGSRGGALDGWQRPRQDARQSSNRSA